MKFDLISTSGAIRSSMLFFGLMILMVSCGGDSSPKVSSEPQTPEPPKFEEIQWNVVALDKEGHSLAVQAFDAAGSAYDVKALQTSEQDQFMSIRAMVKGTPLPVKILMSPNQYVPMKAIGPGGVLYDIHAVTAQGEKLAVMGVVKIGAIVVIEAVTPEGDYYPVRAISPDGKMNTVKGIKINTQDREMTMQGVEVYAHVKSMHQAEDEEDVAQRLKGKQQRKRKNNFKRINWHIEAITADGQNLEVVAMDAEGNQYEVKATQDSEQHSFMNVKAFVEGQELPVRIMDSPDAYAPVRAIGNDGKIFDIKAIVSDSLQYDVRGVGQSGRIVHVKAIDEDGNFLGVKAFSPDGTLNSVKGIKLFDRKVELKSQGHPVYAHVKAIN